MRKLLKPVYYFFLAKYRISGNLGGYAVIPGHLQQNFLTSALQGTLDFKVDTDSLNVLLCAQPKSASLYMTRLLSSALDLVEHKVGFNNKGGSVYYPRLMAAKFVTGNTISHCHAEATPEIVEMIKNLRLRPVILTRNLLDAIVSRRNMLVKDKWASNILSPSAIQQFLDGTEEYQLDVIIDLFADGYINFYAGWDKYRHDHQMRPVFITYQEMLDDEPGLVSRVAKELGFDMQLARARNASEEIQKAGGVNFSTGIPGRGKLMLNDRQLAELRRKALMLGCTNEEFLGFRL
jgi:hypothetical protein